ncbi:MAG: SurA N-terminal domain-containing protein [Granulosicoccus sp.]
MLLDLREKVRSSKPLKYSLITLICIPFALVGIGSYFAGGTAEPVAEVNGQPIDPQQLERAYQQQRQQLARMFGGQLPEAFANENLLRQQALQQLITQQVLESEVAKQKFAVGDQTLGRAIRNLPNFQVDGRFDTETYQLQLRASGMSVPAFEQSFRDDTAINQFRTGITDTSFTLPQEAARLAELGGQTRTIEAIQFDFEQAKEGIVVSEEDTVSYFDENKGDYNFPQRAKIQYIELNSAELAESIDVSDEEAQSYYENNRGNYMLPEQREASHILLSLDDASEDDQIAKVTDIKTRLEAGESFADLAKEFSDDVGSAELGGSLGVISAGAMVPEFETAVFALESEGSLSEPVKTDFGIHLIQLDSITPESGKPFEDVSEEVVTTIQQDQADKEFFDLRELLIELSFDNPGSLQAASDAVGIDIKTSDWLDSDTDSGPVLSNPQLMTAVFSPDVLEEENNSELIQVGDRHVVVLRVEEHEDPRPKTLEDVRDEVVEALKGERATEQLTAQTEAALELLLNGDTAEDIAADNELATAFEQEVLDRQSTVFDRNVITQIFSLPKINAGSTTDSATLSDGDLLALRLDAVEAPTVDSDESENEATGSAVPGVTPSGANPRLGGTEFEVLLESLRENADVEISAAVSP